VAILEAVAEAAAQRLHSTLRMGVAVATRPKKAGSKFF